MRMAQSTADDDHRVEEELQEAFARMFTEEESPRAQDWINWLDETVDRLAPDSDLYSRALRKLRDLCCKTGLIPEGCQIVDEILLEAEHPLSQSGFSDVYRGVCNGHPVAVKALRIHIDDRVKVQRAFCSEVIHWKRLEHPNIVPFHGISNLFPVCLVSPWMPYGSVSSYIEQNPEQDRIPWLVDVAKGLNHMHSMGIVHGDLKGANILLDHGFRARLTDFGLTTVMHQTTGFTATASLRGSLRWMAPELLDFERPEGARVSTASDVYSLGMVWWEVLSGQLPFSALRNEMQVLRAMVTGASLSRPEHCPPQLWAITQHCWAREPHERPTMDDILALILQSTPHQDVKLQLVEDVEENTSWSFQWAHDVVAMVDDDSNQPAPSQAHPSSGIFRRDAAIRDRDTRDAQPDSDSLFAMDEDSTHSDGVRDFSAKGLPTDSLFSDPVNDWYHGCPMVTSSSAYAVAFASKAGYVRLYTVAPDAVNIRTFRSSLYGAAAIALSPRNQLATAGGIYDPVTRTWDLDSGAASALPRTTPNTQVQSLLFSASGSQLVQMVAHVDGSTEIQVWQLDPLRLRSRIDTGGQSPAQLVALSVDERMLLAVTVDSEVQVYHLRDDTYVLHKRHRPHLDWPVVGATFLPHGHIRLLHREWWTHRLQCATLHADTGWGALAELPNPAARSWRAPEIACAAFSRNGARVAVGFRAGHVQVYHAADGRAVGPRVLEHASGRPRSVPVTGVAFAATSDCLFATDAAGACWLWHVPTATVVVAFTPHGGVEPQEGANLARFLEMVAERQERRERGEDIDGSMPSSLERDTHMPVLV